MGFVPSEPEAPVLTAGLFLGSLAVHVMTVFSVVNQPANLARFCWTCAASEPAKV